MLIVFFVVSALVSLALTGVLRRYLERAHMLDKPNARSLHARDVPRGGGLAIAVTVLLLQALVIAVGAVSPRTGLAWWLAGAAFAGLGWWDDRRSRRAAVRLLIQLVIAACFSAVVVAGVGVVRPGPMLVLEAVAATLAMVWLVNLFNFMDGADGFAATQAVASALLAAWGLVGCGLAGSALVVVAVAGAALGFLRWNWSPASVFMGDTGSYFLGFQLGAFAVFGVGCGQHPATWAIVVMPFLVDATLTLARRVGTRQRWWEAHNQHAYQKLLKARFAPARLAAWLLAFNLAVCWPLAIWSFRDPRAGAWPAALAFAVAGMIWWMINRRYPDRKGRG